MQLTRNNLYRAIRIGLSAGIASTFALPALAQDEDAAQLDRVEVTGSRIKRADIEGANPVLVIQREDIARTGLANIGDVLQQMTISGSAINNLFNAPDSGGDGTTRVDIRNLGPDRTLVLVNGRRWVKGTTSSGVSNSVDLSTIPVSIVQRIEVLKDGASAVYGSDAIAGVINIITRGDYDGAEVQGQFGRNDEGDGEVQSFNASVGASSDRGNVYFNAAYTKQEDVFAGDRIISSEPTFGTGVSRGSSATPQGRFIFTDPNTGITHDLTRDPTAPSNPSASDFRPFNGAQDRFNFAPDNYLQIPYEQTSIFTQGSYALTDTLTLKAEALYNNRQSQQLQAPAPLFAGSAGILPGVDISATNAYNPFGFDLNAASNFILAGRRFVEAGTRDYFQNVDTYRFGSGIEGSFEAADRFWEWSAWYTYAKSENSEITENLVNHQRLAQATGPSYVRSDGTFGCGTSAATAITGCVPFNFFGGLGSISQAMVDYVTFTSQESNSQEQRNYLGNISGDLFDLPAGPLGFAAGYEWRKESAQDTPDALSVAGIGGASVSGQGRQPTRGSIKVKSFYVEFAVPLLSDVPGAQMLELNLQSRHSDFDSFGTTTNSKLGLRWQPFSDLLVRGTLSEGFRAPGVQDLFGGVGLVDPTLTDPCSDLNNSGASPTVVANCAAQGVPADGSYVQINAQIRVTTGGNPNLQPERSDNATLGLVYSPSWADGFDLELDYYRIELDNTITTVGAQTILDACANSLSLCQFITRDNNGNVTRLLDTGVNIGGTDVSGVDLSMRYQFPATDYGMFSATWVTSYLHKFEEIIPNPVDPSQPPIVDDNVGFNEGDDAFPEFKSNLALVWDYQNWGASWRMQYIDGMNENCADGLTPTLSDLGLCSLPNAQGGPQNHIGSTTYHDVQGSYFLNDWDSRLTVGINNITDKGPPRSITASANSFDASTYRLPGRHWYLRWTTNF
ncbi:MAG: TonB-dependent receptor [Lysobacteraceae bacterium]|nr:MAG: TonB-dependent receptor [Xanthomonadaceae bacterium]